jgi:hypothetical protein
MELIACNFEFFPQGSKVNEFLRPLLDGCVEIRFPYSIGERNSNQFTFDFDSRLKANLLASGGQLTQLTLPKSILKEYDFSFSFNGKVVVVEVEKANREKILYDFLKFHMYLRHGADFGLLFLPKNYPHSSGEWRLFDWGKTRYPPIESVFSDSRNDYCNRRFNNRRIADFFEQGSLKMRRAPGNSQKPNADRTFPVQLE